MQAVEFANISADVLAARGIALDEAAASPLMSEVEAAAIARGAAGGNAVLEAHYAHCRNVSKNPPIDQDCWVFSLDPTGLRSLRGGIAADYLLVVVDPVSGDVLHTGYGAPGRDPSPGTRDPRLGPA